MLSPVALATWISFCIPWAEPSLTTALIEAGSGREPFLIADAGARKDIGRTQTEALDLLRARLRPAEPPSAPVFEELYIGLTQIPISAMRELAIDPEVALDICANLEIGYTLFLGAHQLAEKTEKNPWKRTSLAYNYFRTREKKYDTPYSTRATDYLKSGKLTLPATMNDTLYHAIAAEWSSGLASRHAMRQTTNPSSVLIASRNMADNARKQH